MRPERPRSGTPRVTAKQIAMIHLAKAKLGMDEHAYRTLLLRVGGVSSAKDLDTFGLDKLIDAFAKAGFILERGERRQFGWRDGMASTNQVRLIQSLWCDWIGRETEAGLDAWLERTVKVSSLRFLTYSKAAKAIGALRTMVRRRCR